MKGELQLMNSNLPVTVAPQSVIHNSGDNVTQIANSQGGIININMPAASGPLYNAVTTVCSDFYNLFVIESDMYSGNCFHIRKESALTVSEAVEPGISKRFVSLSDEAKRDIKTFPSIFASLNGRHGNTEPNQYVTLGLVTDIEVLDSEVKISFHPFCSLPPQNLVGLATNLNIHTAAMANEFDRTHWAIKPVDLIAELRTAGFSLPAPF